MGLIGFQCIVGQWRFNLQTFRLAATIPIRINSLSRGSTVTFYLCKEMYCDSGQQKEEWQDKPQKQKWECGVKMLRINPSQRY